VQSEPAVADFRTAVTALEVENRFLFSFQFSCLNPRPLLCSTHTSQHDTKPHRLCADRRSALPCPSVEPDVTLCQFVLVAWFGAWAEKARVIICNSEGHLLLKSIGEQLSSELNNIQFSHHHTCSSPRRTCKT
jgi:hypothetical protein